ncbi:hypothetical protein CQJ94_14295 [Glycomyces fuscus]|nr:hypothetical protein CQJ94_14295 [Glycomyces fuscus]
MIPRLALGDLRERVRRPSYAVTLLGSAVLAYLAVPAADGHWTVVDAGGYRGVYDMAYVGAAVALGGALWLALGGFYVARGSVARDRSTGVGGVLAATPLRPPAYLAGKLLSNVAVLLSMVAVLVAVALVMWWTRGEDTAVDPVGLLVPFLVVTVPVVVAVAAAALLFDTVPGLGGGLGDILWIPVWTVVALGGQSSRAPFGGIGVQTLADPFAASMERAGIAVEGEFSLGFTKVEEPLTPIPWEGLAVDGAFLAERLLIVAAAVALALLPAVWLRVRGTRSAPWSGTREVPGARTVRALRALVPRDLVSAEFRILVSGVSVWWWLGSAVLGAAGLLLPVEAVRAVVLPACWIWPALVWARVWTVQVGTGVEALLAAYPRPARRQLAGWAAGVLLAVVSGAGPLVRLAAAGDTAAVAAWCAGAVFVPALAAALGALGRTPTLFQVLYPMLWYLAVNGVAAADPMGMTGTGPGPVPVVAAGVLLLAVALLAGQARRLRV